MAVHFFTQTKTITSNWRDPEDASSLGVSTAFPMLK